MRWDDLGKLGMAYTGNSFGTTMFYILYDLRDDPSLSKIHLPTPEEDGPVLLLVQEKDYVNIYSELNEMNYNEGFQWMTNLIYKPLGSDGSSDLLTDTPYILVAHLALVGENPEKFFDSLVSMRKWCPN